VLANCLGSCNGFRMSQLSLLRGRTVLSGDSQSQFANVVLSWSSQGHIALCTVVLATVLNATVRVREEGNGGRVRGCLECRTYRSRSDDQSMYREQT